MQLVDAFMLVMPQFVELTSEDDATGLGNAAALQGVEPHGIPNQAKQDRHHDEPPQPPYILLNLNAISKCGDLKNIHYQ